MPEEPEGLISTRAAGSAEVYARLQWRSPDDAPREPLLGTLGRLMDDTEAARLFFEAEEEAVGCVLRGSVMAMTLKGIGEHVGRFLRSVSVHAARTEAVLETRVASTADPVVSSAEAVGDLARCLTGAGVPARFGRVWTPLGPDADCGLGTRGMGDGTLARLMDHPLFADGAGWEFVAPGEASG